MCLIGEEFVRTPTHTYARTQTNKHTHRHTNVRTQNIPWHLNDWRSIVIRHWRCSSAFPIHHITEAWHGELFLLNIPHITEYPYFITFRDSLHKQQFLKQSIEFSLSSIILVQKPTQNETDIPEISPGFRHDNSWCFHVLLTVHLSIILGNDQRDTHLLYFSICFYDSLHVSRLICSSSGGWIVLMQHLVSSHSVSGCPVVRRTATYWEWRYQMLHQYNSNSWWWPYNARNM